MMDKIKDFLFSLGYSLLDTWSDNGQGYKFLKKEPSGKKPSISVFMGSKGRLTVSKRDLADYSNNCIEFTPTELKFFDILGFETSYWHEYYTEQDIADWVEAAEVELNY